MLPQFIRGTQCVMQTMQTLPNTTSDPLNAPVHVGAVHVGQHRGGAAHLAGGRGLQGGVLTLVCRASGRAGGAALEASGAALEASEMWACACWAFACVLGESNAMLASVAAMAVANKLQSSTATLPFTSHPHSPVLTGADGHAAVKHKQRAIPVVQPLLPHVSLDTALEGVQLVEAAVGDRGQFDRAGRRPAAAASGAAAKAAASAPAHAAAAAAEGPPCSGTGGGAGGSGHSIRTRTHPFLRRYVP